MGTLSLPADRNAHTNINSNFQMRHASYIFSRVCVISYRRVGCAGNDPIPLARVILPTSLCPFSGQFHRLASLVSWTRKPTRKSLSIMYIMTGLHSPATHRRFHSAKTMYNRIRGVCTRRKSLRPQPTPRPLIRNLTLTRTNITLYKTVVSAIYIKVLHGLQFSPKRLKPAGRGGGACVKLSAKFEAIDIYLCFVQRKPRPVAAGLCC